MLDKEKIAEILSLDSWEAIFNGLGDLGFSYIRKGGGAVIKSEEEEIKASSVGRFFSLYNMEDRLGPLPDAVFSANERLDPDEAVSLENLARKAARLRLNILQAIKDGDTVKLEKLCELDPRQVRYFTERFRWFVDNGRKALPDATVCEMWIRQARFEPVNCKAPAAELYLWPDEGLVHENFTKYQKALGAESFQVPCAGNGQTMRFHDLEGYPAGIPADVLPGYFGRLLDLNARFEMIAFKPLSRDWIYIFVHNVTFSGMNELLELGILPAYVQEISPDLFQAIVKIPKTGDTEADRTIEVEMSRALNLIAGDCMPGSRRPHFAPGFVNWRGVEKDGAYPISAAENYSGQSCGFLAEYGAWALENRPEPVVGQFVPEHEPVKADSVALYRVHARDALHKSHEKIEEVDRNVLDMKVATRLRATGHSEGEVADILAEAGRKIRPDAHDWDDYSKRTARKAFSDDRILLRYERWFERWHDMERRVASACHPFRAGAMT